MSSNNGKARVQRIKLASIRTDGGTQARLSLDADQVESCQQAVRGGVKLPPVVIFEDPEANRWLADGFHRREGHLLEGKDMILAEIRPGTRLDAILYAAGANSVPGVLRMANADKRHAVEIVLAEEPLRKLSDRAIAQIVGVSHPTVAAVRAQLENFSSCPRPETRIGLDGRERSATTSGDSDTSGDQPETDDLASHNGTPTGSNSVAEVVQDDWTEPNAEDSEIQPALPVVPVDHLGIPLMDDMREVFACVDEFHAIAQALSNLQRRVADLAATPAGAVYATQLRGTAGKDDAIRYRDEHLLNARNKVLWAAPYSSVCPYCHHEGETLRDCKACHGLGWVTQRAFEVAPQDYQDAVRELARKEGAT